MLLFYEHLSQGEEGNIFPPAEDMPLVIFLKPKSELSVEGRNRPQEMLFLAARDKSPVLYTNLWISQNNNNFLMSGKE